jgi:hypothetical protein
MDLKEYNRIHDFIRKNKIGNKCEHCHSENKRLDNALIIGKNHSKNIENYIKLCRKCHYKYDHPNGRKHTKEAKIKIGIASKLRILNSVCNEKFIKARLGKKITDEHKKIISLKMSGENHHQSKLTKKDALYILESKEKPTFLAIKFNVTYRTIANIKSRKTWKNLD